MYKVLAAILPSIPQAISAEETVIVSNLIKKLTF